MRAKTYFPRSKPQNWHIVAICQFHHGNARRRHLRSCCFFCALSLFGELAQRTSVGQMRQIRLLAILKYSVSPTGFGSIRFGERMITSRWTEEFVYTGFLHTSQIQTRAHTPCMVYLVASCWCLIS
jgi:hypothetical protein